MNRVPEGEIMRAMLLRRNELDTSAAYGHGDPVDHRSEGI
jgi:hypothetical protein